MRRALCALVAAVLLIGCFSALSLEAQASTAIYGIYTYSYNGSTAVIEDVRHDQYGAKGYVWIPDTIKGNTEEYS